MLRKKFDAIVEEIAEVQSLAELKALHCFGQEERNEYADVECVPLFRTAVVRLKAMPPVQGEGREEAVVEDLQAKLNELLAQLEVLKGETPAAVPVAPVAGGGKKYRLLKTEVAWSTKPQVQALMEILKAHAKVGDVLDEVDIVRAMVANEGVLKTRQGGKRIWDYYKGDHAEGLTAHGNVEKV